MSPGRTSAREREERERHCALKLLPFVPTKSEWTGRGGPGVGGRDRVGVEHTPYLASGEGCRKSMLGVWVERWLLMCFDTPIQQVKHYFLNPSLNLKRSSDKCIHPHKKRPADISQLHPRWGRSIHTLATERLDGFSPAAAFLASCPTDVCPRLVSGQHHSSV